MIIITHLLAGILIQIICFKLFNLPLNFLLTILFAFLSHFILDAFVNITYHTPDPQKGDKFWQTWRIIDYGVTILILIFFIPYILGMILANFVDIIDWLILRPIHRRNIKKENYKWDNNYLFHTSIAKFRTKCLFWLPDWRYKKFAIIPEIIIMTILLIFIIILR